MTDTPSSQDQASSGQFGLQRIYVKDISFEAPATPRIFLNDWKPEVGVQIATNTTRIDDNNYEVVLTITVTAKVENQTAYLVEVKQAGLFAIAGVPESQMTGLLGSYCPNILFPFAREVISDIVTRGSFPQLLLSPINFDALLAEGLRQQAAKQNEAPAEATH